VEDCLASDDEVAPGTELLGMAPMHTIVELRPCGFERIEPGLATDVEGGEVGLHQGVVLPGDRDRRIPVEERAPENVRLVTVAPRNHRDAVTGSS
jgi:hypothetical protein